MKRDLVIEFGEVDSIFLETGNVVYQNAKFRVSDQNQKMLIQHSTQLFLYDFAVDSIVKSIELDTLPLVLPEVNLGGALYSDVDQSIALFFPQKAKIYHLDSGYNLVKELSLSRLDDIGHMFLPYGEVFYYNPAKNLYYIGMMKNEGDIVGFLEDTRFVGIFDSKTGQLIDQFAGFSEERKAHRFEVLSEGLFYMDVHSDEFYIRDVVGSQTVTKWDLSGKWMGSYRLGSERMNMELQPYSEGDFAEGKRSDYFYGLKVIGEDRVVSNIFLRDYPDGKERIEGLLLVEDFTKNRSYSKEIYPFQKIVHVSDSTIWMVRNHPLTEDMVLVAIEYSLEK
ncbi:hypothetical protein J0A68_05615 [Algoriphagus sp. H41]|uniref:TolB-like 6-blade propeller-like n=1 Tax=Algoriphagus oliviformis TaxID=2811231 RepID=A0ABS3C0H5_9BACT|nr:hypothetical protein [Algoriphagus oliviformis]MBN7810422.1 hypothetical protein [Algoriphagus oliviformis]